MEASADLVAAASAAVAAAHDKEYNKNRVSGNPKRDFAKRE